MRELSLIDSINFGSYSFEYLFDNANYIIEDIKIKGYSNKGRWLKEFGKKLPNSVIEAKIVHTYLGVKIPLKRFASKPEIQVIEFAGINGFTDRSMFLKNELFKLLPNFSTSLVKRIDISIDFPRIPNRVIKKLCLSGRIDKKYKNTIYYKTEKEKKTNPIIDIKRYSKQKRDGLGYPLERLEFAFKGKYFDNKTLDEIDKIFYKKMEASIFRFSGLNCKIVPIS